MQVKCEHRCDFLNIRRSYVLKKMKHVPDPTALNIWDDSYKFGVLFRSLLDNQTEQGLIETLPSEGLIPIFFSLQSKTLKYTFHLFVPNLSDCVIKTNKVTLS